MHFFEPIYGAQAWWRSRAARRHLRTLLASDPEALRAAWLQAQLRHAVGTVPHYAEQFPGHATPALTDFPILTRATLRARQAELHSSAVDRRHCSQAATGGSTGEPVWLTRDRQAQLFDHLTDMYYYQTLLGMPLWRYLSHRRLLIWYRRPHQRRLPLQEQLLARLGQTVRLETNQALSEDRLRHYVQTINRVRPRVIRAFANPLFELARYALRQGLRLHRPEVLTSSVEMLYPHMREIIEQAFDCPVQDYYGAAETGRVAAQCRQGRWHVFIFNAHVEVLDATGQPVGAGELGRLVITPLHSRAMPLIRYDVGDEAVQGSAPCPCGSPLPVLDGIRGRVIEHFVNQQGEAIYGGNFMALFYEREQWLQSFQILQEEVDRIRVVYQRMPDSPIPPGTFERIEAAMAKLLGGPCRVNWQEVDVMPRSPVGKHLYTRSLVWEARQNF